MQTKALILAALISGWSAPLMAASLSGETAVRSPTTATPKNTRENPGAARVGKALVLKPAPDLPGDILGGRGPNPHAGELNRLAIYSATGNIDGAEMLAAELSQAGVSRQAMQNAIDRTMAHGHSSDTPPAPAGREQHADNAWEATQ